VQPALRNDVSTTAVQLPCPHRAPEA
jgi:hypothetical protein